MLIEALKSIPDPRSFHGKEYALWQILLISILSILANGKGYSDIKKQLDKIIFPINVILIFL